MPPGSRAAAVRENIMHQHHHHGASLLDFAIHHCDGLRLQQRHFSRGSLLFVPHDDASCVFVIRHGKLRVYVPTEDGSQVFLADLAVGGDADALRASQLTESAIHRECHLADGGSACRRAQAAGGTSC